AFEAQAQIDELLVEGVDDSFGANGVAGGGVFEPRAFRGTVALEQFQPVRGIPVGVRIDRAARATPGPRAVVAILWNVAHRLTPDLLAHWLSGHFPNGGRIAPMVPILRVVHKRRVALH